MVHSPRSSISLGVAVFLSLVLSFAGADDRFAYVLNLDFNLRPLRDEADAQAILNAYVRFFNEVAKDDPLLSANSVVPAGLCSFVESTIIVDGPRRRRLQRRPVPTIPTIPSLLNDIIRCSDCGGGNDFGPDVDASIRPPPVPFRVVFGDERRYYFAGFAAEPSNEIVPYSVIATVPTSSGIITFVDIENRLEGLYLAFYQARPAISWARARLKTARAYLVRVLEGFGIEPVCVCKGLTLMEQIETLPLSPVFQATVNYIQELKLYLADAGALLDDQEQDIRNLVQVLGEALSNAYDITSIIETGTMSDKDDNGCPIPWNG